MPRTCLSCVRFDRLFSLCDAPGEPPYEVVETEAEGCPSFLQRGLAVEVDHDDAGHVIAITTDAADDERRASHGR